MAGVNGDAHAGAGHCEVRSVQDTARLVAQLLLLIGLFGAVIDDGAGERHDVEGDGRNVHIGFGQGNGAAIEGQARDVLLEAGLELAGQLGDAGAARSGNSLVGGYEEALDAASSIDERLEDGHGGHGRAVGVCNDALGTVVDVVGVDLGNDQRDLGILAPRRGVVDDDRAGSRELGSILTRGRSSRREDRNIDPREVSSCDVFDDDLFALPRQGRSSRTSGRKETNRFNWEIALFQDRAHHATNLAGRTDNSNSQT